VVLFILVIAVFFDWVVLYVYMQVGC